MDTFRLFHIRDMVNAVTRVSHDLRVV